MPRIELPWRQAASWPSVLFDGGGGDDDGEVDEHVDDNDKDDEDDEPNFEAKEKYKS